MDNQPTINGITPCKQYKYLGIILQKNGKSNLEYEHMIKKLKNFNKYKILSKA